MPHQAEGFAPFFASAKNMSEHGLLASQRTAGTGYPAPPAGIERSSQLKGVFTEWSRIVSSDGCKDGARSPEELRAYIESMAPEEKRRLLAAAVMMARTAYWGDPEDLMQGAFEAAISGSRRCPVDVQPLTFLVGAMRSMLSNERDKMSRIDLVDMQDDENNHLAGTSESPEAAFERADRLKNLATKVAAHFGDDDRPMMVFEGRAEGLSRSEIRDLLEMDQVSYESMERRIRRFMNKEFPGRNS